MNKAQIPYLSIFFHELKSPLSAIANTAKLIELSLDKPDVEKIRKYTSLIISQAFFSQKLHLKYHSTW
ncbi:MULTISPECIES: histidine kinase [Thermodesulfovibrio]|uniref:histidine kinase n=1 Tax=Thermodesulfovibrio yellowstonii (strain ATCC 51303 / DSM 11347 / YP87) TaxID=289376 RepID=B5YH88_THEYD|nr:MULTISPECIES: histidine kinase [Thermodesulfovibrio]ACI21367.1 nitrogen assimilation sensor kinase [Thermodesulfovibrio yellowstonii DSM 11347]